MELSYCSWVLGVLFQFFLIYCNNSSNFNFIYFDEENFGVCILCDFKYLVDVCYY